MHKRSSDTLSEYNAMQDLYCVRSIPGGRSDTRKHVMFNNEEGKLERELYAKLQGHKGRILPFAGSIFRLGVISFLFPYYVVKSLVMAISKRVNKRVKKLEQFFTPKYRRFCSLLNRINGRISLAFNRLAIRFRKILTLFTNIALQIRNKTIPIFKYITEKQLMFIRGLKKAANTLNKLVGLVKQIPIGQKTFMRYRKVLSSWIPKKKNIKNLIKIFNHFPSIDIKVLEFLRFVKRGVKSRLVRVSAWMRVLSDYGLRVLEDWTLEMKQWFSPR